MATEARLKVQRKYREAHHEELKEKSRNYMRRRREATTWFSWYLLKRYNVTEEQYWQKWDEQDGRCAIKSCEYKLDAGPKRPHLDHDHKTGLFRGLLCFNHNRAFGSVNDSIKQLEDMIDYLKKNGEG